VSQTSADFPSDPPPDVASDDGRAHPHPTNRSRPALVPVDGEVAPDQFSRDLHDIALANRVLASRVAELDAELHRQVAAAERLHTQVAVEMQRNVTAESLAEIRNELTALQSSRLFRWSSVPRRAYGRLRRLVRSR
jgi:hypothetical protein